MPASPPPTAPPPTAPKPVSAPPPPPSKAAPTSAPPESKADEYQDAFADIDQMETGKKPAPKKEAAKQPDPTDADGAEEPSETPTTKIGSDDAKSVKPATEDSSTSATQKPVKAAELRTAYEGLKKKVKEEYEPQVRELTTLRAMVMEIESRDETAGKQTQERIAQIEKRNAELENHIKFVNYEQSTEYQEKFQKPYVEAWGNALRELKGLSIKIEDPQSGEEKVREMTQADIAYLANLDPAARRTEINRLFPDDKEEVKRHVNQISYLAQKSQEAKEKAKADAETHSKTVSDQQQQSQKARADFWKKSNESLATKYPQWFSPAEGDQEGNALLERGAALADLAFNPAEITPERVELLPKIFREQIASGKPFTQQQVVQLHAIVRNKSANHDRLARQNQTFKERISELENNLKQFEKSMPDNIPAGQTRTASNGISDAGDELEALARKHK